MHARSRSGLPILLTALFALTLAPPASALRINGVEITASGSYVIGAPVEIVLESNGDVILYAPQGIQVDSIELDAGQNLFVEGGAPGSPPAPGSGGGVELCAGGCIVHSFPGFSIGVDPSLVVPFDPKLVIAPNRVVVGSAPIPEPRALLIWGLALSLLGLRSRRRESA